MCRGDLAAARVEFEKAIELDPTFVPAWQGLAQASRLIGDKGAADQAEAKANALTAT
jgi:Tfp pilus assembly protein PilF